MYTLVVNPGNRFVVVNNTLYTSSAADLNYEAQQSWNIRVKSTDDGTPPLSVEENFTVTVLDVNEAPNYIGITGEKVWSSFEHSPKRKDLHSMQYCFKISSFLDGCGIDMPFQFTFQSQSINFFTKQPRMDVESLTSYWKFDCATNLMILIMLRWFCRLATLKRCCFLISHWIV